ncbi:MAG: hypothetical protein K2Q26_07550 [Bdellovibrionales bacterium]|nr:hypothetical protein [Bdellovibrionales bacterium]
MNKKMILSLVVMMTVGVSVAFSKSNSNIQQLADQFLVDQQIMKHKMSQMKGSAQDLFSTKHAHPNCPPEGASGSCIDSVCTKLGQFGCDTQSEISQVANICKGNVDGDCVEASCTKLGQFGCDTISEVTEVAVMCKGQANGQCVEIACQKLGQFGCDTVSELSAVQKTVCKPAVDPACLESVCNKLSTFGCDTLSELQEVSNSCAGL